MTAEIESMMFAGAAPWHGLGVPVPEEVTSREAIQLAGLDWGVQTVPVQACAEGNPAVPGCRAVVRTSDNKPLAVVGQRYEPIQNEDAFAFFDSIVGEGAAVYHTAGSLDGGRKTWMLAKLPGEVRIGRWDVVEKFLLLANSHDGTSALRVLLTPVRVICGNTLAIALAGASAMAVRHTANASARLAEAQRVLEVSTQYYGAFDDHAKRLAAQRFSDSQMQKLAKDLLPGSENGVSSRTTKAREKVVELFSEGRGHDLIRGTAWAALNAVAEYVDHERPTRARNGTTAAEARVRSAWFGAGAALKRQAHELIVQQLAA